MQYMSLLTMVALSMFMRNLPKDNTLPITQRVSIAAETTKTKMQSAWTSVKHTAAVLKAYFGGDSLEEQTIRLRLFQKLNPKKHHPKRWVVWIVANATMPVKHPDEQVSDAQYQEYYVLYKQLLKGEEPLTHEEEIEARHEGMQLLYEYRHAKGLPQVA